MPTMSFTYTSAYGQRVAAALGKAWNLKDTQDPPQPRAATLAEVRDFIRGRVRQLVVDIEGAELTKAAVDSVVVPEGDLT